MLKLLTLISLALIGTHCLGSDAGPSLTRSASGTFYIKGKAVTAHEAACQAKTPLDVKLDGFLPVINLNGTTHSISLPEYMSIKETEDLMKLAVIHKLSAGTGSYPELAAAQNALARKIKLSEEIAKIKLADKQKAKKAAAAAGRQERSCSIQ